jgi:hypothetical protein
MKFATQLLQRSFPPHVRWLLMPIAMDFSTLWPGEGDLSNDICAKIAALGHFSPFHDECILSICAPFLARRDQVLVAVLELFASCPALVSKHPDTTKQMLQQVLGGTDYSWVQRVSVLELTEGLNQYEISVWMPEYISACVNFVVASTFSLETVLAQTARRVAAEFVSRGSLEIFARAIYSVANSFDSCMVNLSDLKEWTTRLRVRISHHVTSVSPGDERVFCKVAF